jgi:replication factor C subunit 1
VRAGQNWSLLPQVAALNLRVTSIAAGNIGFPGFPEWLGKNSARGKKRRLLSETAMHMRQKANGVNAKALRMDYLCTLRGALLRPLLHAQGKDEVAQTIQLMDDYGLNRDDLFETMQEVRIALNKPDPFAKLTSQTKAAFTREYNKGSHTSQALVAEAAIVGLKRSKGSKKRAAEEGEEGEGEPGEGEDGGDDDDEEQDAEELDVAELKKLAAKAKPKPAPKPAKPALKPAPGKGRAPK